MMMMMVVRAAVCVAIILVVLRVSLTVLLALHSSILEPYFHLPLRQVQVPGQLPSLLFGDVRVVQKLFLQLQRLELGVWLAFLAH